ncbi:MAG: hypothetical protein HY658_12295 [Actinobacteria bacterium]|nr:hypothetical protein [Actinomycetota bacterium]
MSSLGQPPPPAAPPPPGSRAPRSDSPLAVVWGAVAGVLIASLVLVLLVARSGTPGGPDGSVTRTVDPTATPTADETASPPGPEVTGLVEEEAIPGVGADVYVGGGLARVPVPAGWRLLARGDRLDDPGGYSESAVLENSGSGVSLGVYLLAESTDPAGAPATAEAIAREWVRDGSDAGFEPARAVGPSGALAGAAAVRYRYVRGSAIEGEVVVAVRAGGVTLLVFVDAGQGELEATRDVWEPLREAILGDFAS